MWSWLSKLPGIIGGGIKSGVNKIGGAFGGDQGDSSMARTPDFNPAARAVKIGRAGDLAQANGIDNVSRAGNIASASGTPDEGGGVLYGNGGGNKPKPLSVEPVSLPTEVPYRPAAAPPITGFNVPEEARATMKPAPLANPSALPNLPAPGKYAPMEPMADPAAISAPSLPRPMEASRKDIPIPSLPGRKGGPTPYSDYDAAKYDSIMAHAKPDMSGVQRSGKSIFQNALLGASRAYAMNPQGGLGALAGGALGGGLGATLNPTEGYSQVFDAGEGRQMQEQQGRQQALQFNDLRRRDLEAGVNLKEAQAKRAMHGAGNVGEATWGTYDLTTGQPIWQRPAGVGTQAAPRRYNVNGALVDEQGNVVYQGQPKPERPRTLAEAEAERADEEGTAEQIAQDSFNDAGRQQAIFSRLPKAYQDALKSGGPDLSKLPTEYQQALSNPKNADPATLTKAENARNQLLQQHQQTVIAAQNELQQLQQRELAEIRRYTDQEARRKAAGRKSGRPAPMGGVSGKGNGPTAKLSDLTKYLQ